MKTPQERYLELNPTEQELCNKDDLYFHNKCVRDKELKPLSKEEFNKYVFTISVTRGISYQPNDRYMKDFYRLHPLTVKECYSK